ncbi:hypothetical protein ACPRNU_23550 [Chromobacterium vaccinii]|uniref:hypothetical protein n=1 Tax=Chromobacterium vaccinii TaxID=1108595 RepID=UPI003C75C7EB
MKIAKEELNSPLAISRCLLRSFHHIARSGAAALGLSETPANKFQISKGQLDNFAINKRRHLCSGQAFFFGHDIYLENN